ncbi:hypothetical protein quinque_000937 [Culex quinquefasciatus]|uniref:(northern house mosquito) hypothetical protein n=1 Tax=Culex pipiens TaxID=7175 RepID=A0A8D8D2Z4_CULPI|nr:uncharacterized protein LOC119768071 [Culex quinquefasciatus]XP_038114352.1 uncharacterized protein LOC119768071 [Culex quinquefasciatus]XP_038114353.1 uncharacterized protein LOC119768071 [Culex quinquefasciatus]XP_038114354.1 uncharacterized protein LOC119768071 [Culex quinquefasciatus]XP_038114355.1 uncharacterized protein LOC119768071 [Culex quinquefasciatus]XP_038114356.1 uncharacterized protein LOC119768071 [Culex quinquefasciatus]XP_039437201.1 uncharacterized protein LOC120418788 [
MEHGIISKYTDVRVKISGWDERVQQFPKDCPCCSVGRATYRTFGYSNKHFIPKTTTQSMYDDVWGQFCAHGRRFHPNEHIDFESYRSTYQRDYPGSGGPRLPLAY